MANILDNVALSATGAFTAASYRQRPPLQEIWERAEHEAIESLDCDHSDSNDFIRNILGSVWYNRNRGSGISRVLPRDYSYRIGTFGTSILADVTSAMTNVSATTGYKPISYARPWYAYKMDLVGMDGVPLQWQSSSSDNDAGDLRIIGQSPTSLTALQIDGTDPVTDGREVYNVHYKPQRFYLLTDAEQDTIWSANADSANTELHRFVTRDYKFSARNLTLPHNWLYFSSDLNVTTGALAAGAVPIPEGTTKTFPTVNVLMTWHDIPWYPLAAIVNCLGKVNTATTGGSASGNWDYQPTVDGTNWPRRSHAGFPAGSLLFDGVHDLVEHTNAAGQWVIDITYSFIHRPAINGSAATNTWNSFFNYTTNAFATAVTKESIGTAQASWKYLYESVDFNSLFKLPIA